MTLSWSTTDATSVTINQAIGSVPTSGSRSVTPTQTTTYMLTAQGAGGTNTKSVTVTVLPTGNTYQASRDLSDTQGLRNWNYLESSNSQMTWDSYKKFWRGSEQYALLTANGGHPGNNVDVTRRWTAPASGSIRITGGANDADPNNANDGVLVSIKKGDAVLWQHTIANGDTTGVSYDVTTTVAAGETIDFTINKIGNNGNDSTNFDPTIVLTPATDPAPFGGTPAAAPGRIEAENFDNGSQGVSYQDVDAGNNGGTYRTTDVDVRANSSASNSHVVFNAYPGEWLKYTVNVTRTGAYTVGASVSAHQEGGTFHIEVDGVDVTGPIKVPNTGSWWSFQTVGKSGVPLAAGTHIVRLVLDTGGAEGVVADFDTLILAGEFVP